MGPVRYLDALPLAGKEHGVLSHDITGAYRLHADLLARPLADDPFAGEDADLIQVPVQRLRQHLRHLHGRAGGRVLLHAVVGLDDLHVVIVTERCCHLFQDLEGKINADAHVRREHAGDLVGELPDLLHLFLRESRRADHDRTVMVGAGADMLEARLGSGEIDEHFSRGEGGIEIFRDGDARRRQSGGPARVLAHERMTFLLNGPRKADAFHAGQYAYDPRTHAARGPGHDSFDHDRLLCLGHGYTLMHTDTGDEK